MASNNDITKNILSGNFSDYILYHGSKGGIDGNIQLLLTHHMNNDLLYQERIETFKNTGK